MRVEFVCRLAGITAVILSLASTALADYTITVKIGDTTLPSVTNGPVPIPAGNYTYGTPTQTVTIANSGGQAQVEFSSAKSDGAEDSIKLVNARITASGGDVNNFPISFQGQEQPNPNQQPIYYKMKAVGLFEWGSGSSLLVGMYLKNPTSEGFTFLNQQQKTPPAIQTPQTVTIAPSGTAWPPVGHSQLNGTRILRVDMAFKLAPSKYLDFNTSTNARSVEMYSSGTPDCDPTDPTCQEDPGLYLPSLLEWNGDLGRQAWYCRWFGLFCSDWP